MSAACFLVPDIGFCLLHRLIKMIVKVALYCILIAQMFYFIDIERIYACITTFIKIYRTFFRS